MPPAYTAGQKDAIARVMTVANTDRSTATKVSADLGIRIEGLKEEEEEEGEEEEEEEAEKPRRELGCGSMDESQC